MLRELALPAAGVLVTAACFATLAATDGGLHGPFAALAGHGAWMLAPLAFALLLTTAPVQSALQRRLSPRTAAILTPMACAGYLAALAGAAAPAPQPAGEVFLRTLLLAGLPMALFAMRRPPQNETSPAIDALDVAAGTAIMAVAGLKVLGLRLHLGSRSAGLLEMDAAFFAWLAVLAVYVVLVRRLPLGFSLRVERRDLAVAVATYGALMAVLLPLAFAIGMVAEAPSSKPASEVLFFVTYYLFRIAFGEELFFRLVLQSALIRWASARCGERRGAWLGLAIASVVFGLCHYRFGGGFAVLAALAGLGYGWAYLATGRLTAPVLVHGLVDITNALLH
ncbi:MAG: CPBP family intramembrane metalloprotease [Candidatus Wallbacteria bacterium]|nr:CPBP family intramembrane metalloprotease [Candidatus Wallbacteria bacterium]